MKLNWYKLVAEIYLSRFQHNVRSVLSRIPSKTTVIGVIKCDAYGHGAAPIARSLLKAGVSYLAVSDLWEGRALREQGICCPILLLSDPPGEKLEEVVWYNLTAAISSFEVGQALASVARRLRRIARVHINVDTGMGRFGLSPDAAVLTAEKFRKYDHLEVEGIFSHLSSAYRADPVSDEYTLDQIRLFNNVLERLSAKGLLPSLVHIGNSPALTGFAEQVMSGFCNAIRIGTLFFGFAERPCEWARELVPVAEVSTFILFEKQVRRGQFISYDRTFRAERDSRIAVLPIGYGDGLHRALSNRGQVAIGTERAPIVGKICLGQTIVDVTGLNADVSAGSRVVLAGKEISAFEEAQRCGLGTWEFLLPLLFHSKKIYIE